MEKVISLLFDIERKANTIIERANFEKNELSKETEQALIDLEDLIGKETSAKILELETRSEKDLENEKKKLINQYHQQLQIMEDNYQQNHDELLQTVFQEIIKI